MRRRRGAAAFGIKAEALDAGRHLARTLSVTPSAAERHGLAPNKDGQRRTAMDLLSYPNIGFTDGPGSAGARRISLEIAQQIEIDGEILGLSGSLLPTSRPTGATKVCAARELRLRPTTALSRKFGRSELIRPRTIGQLAGSTELYPAALTLLVAHNRAKAEIESGEPLPGVAHPFSERDPMDQRSDQALPSRCTRICTCRLL